MAAAARVDVPMFPVPMSLQTWAVLTVAALYGARYGGQTIVAYLAAAAIGLPVLAGGAGGWERLVGPTAGYLAGFLFAAFVVGGLASTGRIDSLARAFAAMLVGHGVILMLGVLRLWRLPDYDLDLALEVGAIPFLAGAVVKSLAAALCGVALNRTAARRVG